MCECIFVHMCALLLIAFYFVFISGWISYANGIEQFYLQIAALFVTSMWFFVLKSSKGIPVFSVIVEAKQDSSWTLSSQNTGDICHKPSITFLHACGYPSQHWFAAVMPVIRTVYLESLHIDGSGISRNTASFVHNSSSSLLFWQAPLGVHSAIHRHQPPQRTVLGQIDCFIQCEFVGCQIALDGVQPRDTRTPCYLVGDPFEASWNLHHHPYQQQYWYV